jgi:predicted metal-dependent peptidase
MTIKPRPPTPSESTFIADTLLAARLYRPYYARAIAALTPLVVEGLGTVAVSNRWHIYMDLDWLRSLPERVRAAVIAAHEIEHLLRKHGKRQEDSGLPPSIAWNVAGDMEINDDLDPGDLPPGGALPRHLGQPDGLLAEEYLLVMKDECCKSGHCGGGSGAGNPLEGEPESGGLSPRAASATLEQTAQDTLAHEQKNPGSVAKGALVWAKEAAAKVRVPWPRRLAAALARKGRAIMAGREDFSYSRMNRRQRPCTALRPAMVKRRPRVGVVVDTSGSMASIGPEALGVVADAARRLGELVVWSCDVEAHRMRGDLRRMQWKGGGGTDLRPAIAEAERVADVVVVVTDGFTPWPERVSVPVIVALIPAHGSGGVPPVPEGWEVVTVDPRRVSNGR